MSEIVCAFCKKKTKNRGLGLCHNCYNRQWVKKNPERVHIIRKKIYEKNREKIKKEVKQWQSKNLEKVKHYKKKHSQTKKGKISQLMRSHRQLSKIYNVSFELTREDIQKLQIQSICAYCGKDFKNSFDKCIDHIKAYTKQGDTEKENLVYCCRKCNTSKSNLSVEEWEHKKQSQKLKKCEVCDTIILKRISWKEYSKKRFCSIRCFKIWWQKNAKRMELQ